MDTIAFIPVRGGSKTIEDKNINLLAGKPLVHWAIQAAIDCNEIKNVYVSSDSSEIRAVANMIKHPKLKVINRSANNASDTASTESALLEFSENYSFDRVVLIQATNPFLLTEDICGALKLMEKTKCDSVVSVTREHKFMWGVLDGFKALPVNYDPEDRPRRQDWDGIFLENGSFYLTKRQSLIESKCRTSGKTQLYEMKKVSNLEIDTLEDWELAEKLLGEPIDYERWRADRAVIDAAWDMLYNSKFINDTEKINAIIDALRAHPDYDEEREGE